MLEYLRFGQAYAVMSGYLHAIAEMAALQGYATFVDELSGVLQIVGRIVNFGGRILTHPPQTLKIYRDYIYIDDYIKLPFGGRPLYLYGHMTPLAPYDGNYIGTYYNGEFTSFDQCKWTGAGPRGIAGTLALDRYWIRIDSIKQEYAYDHGPCFIVQPTLVYNLGGVAVIGVDLVTYFVIEGAAQISLSTERINCINIGKCNFALLKDATNGKYILSDSHNYFVLAPLSYILESGYYKKEIESMFIASFQMVNDCIQKK